MQSTMYLYFYLNFIQFRNNLITPLKKVAKNISGVDFAEKNNLFFSSYGYSGKF